MQICKMSGRQINQALELIRKVFDECDKEDYEDMGILSFYHFTAENRLKNGCRVERWYSLVHMKSLNWSA